MMITLILYFVYFVEIYYLYNLLYFLNVKKCINLTQISLWNMVFFLNNIVLIEYVSMINVINVF